MDTYVLYFAGNFYFSKGFNSPNQLKDKVFHNKKPVHYFVPNAQAFYS